MTPNELREARIAEARRRAEANIGHGRYDENLISSLYDLIEQDWQPNPEVDPVTLAFREWGRASGYAEESVDTGLFDDFQVGRAFRAGYNHAMINHPDTKRMDWLEERWVSVEAGRGKYIDHKVPLDVAPDFRTKIDQAINAKND